MAQQIKTIELLTGMVVSNATFARQSWTWVHYRDPIDPTQLMDGPDPCPTLR